MKNGKCPICKKETTLYLVEMYRRPDLPLCSKCINHFDFFSQELIEKQRKFKEVNENA